jgi:hypothetical protein
MAQEATAKELPDGKFEVTHEDGTVEVLTEKQFHDKYKEGDVDNGADEKPAKDAPTGSQSGDEDPDTVSKRNRPHTHDRDDAFVEDGDFGGEYTEEVEAELSELEEGVKAVRAELKSTKSGKSKDFGALRSAMHKLIHGKSLLRTAHVATVRHDGPERLRPAPTAETNQSSGPGEELNPEQAAGRVVGR